MLWYMNGGLYMQNTQIPIYIDGKKEGTLTIQRQGAATVMRAELRDVGRVVRLNVYGEKTGYLGVPAPEDGRLRLVRRLSPMEMDRFPRRPEYAGDRPIERDRPAEKQKKEPPQGDLPQGIGRHVLWMGGKPYFF